jgi:hypothetical protein
VFFGLQQIFCSPDSSRILTFHVSRLVPTAIRFLSLENGSLIHEISGFQAFGQMAPSPAGNEVAFQFTKTGESAPRIGLADFKTASINQSERLEFQGVDKISWSNDGQLLLLQGTALNNRRKQSLLSVPTLEILGNWSEFSIDVGFDLTRPPIYLDHDFNEDGSLDALDFFLLQKQWDPMYPEVGYQFMKKFKNR